MTTYIIWNIIDDAAFRPRYLEVTGEAIQTDPIQSAGGMQYMIGSSRITAEQLAVLQSGTQVRVIYSHSHSQNLSRFWVDSDTAEEASQTFDTTTGSASATVPKIGARGDASQIIGSSTHLNAAAAGNSFLTDAEAAGIRAIMLARRS